MSGPPGGAGPEPSRVSVVVLTHERRDELLGNLDRLRRQYPDMPVIVVDNGSRDGTAEAVATGFPEVTLVRAPGNLGAAGRNLGVAAAGTPYVAFCDDDTCWESGALEAAQQLLDAAPRAGVISACVRMGPAGTVDPTCDITAPQPPGTGTGGHRAADGLHGGRLHRAARGLPSGGRL